MKTLAHIFILIISLGGCEKNDPKPKTELEKLPPATQEGKNTFGCLVDGKAWVTKTSTNADAYYQEGVLFISAGLINNDLSQRITISLFDMTLSEKEYLLTDYPDIFGRLTDLKINCEYVTSSTYTGKLIITHFDPINYIISGTFEFDAYSLNCNSTIKITEGRFDLTYAP